MINRINSLPEFSKISAEAIKIQNLFAAYKDDCELFIHDSTGTVIFSLGGDMIICGNAKSEEIKKFVSFIKPKSIFSAADNFENISGNFERTNVLICKNCRKSNINTFEYDFSSREAYELLKTEEFFLPPYEYFATDYCHRKNHGLIKVFGKKDTCIAITLEGENYRLLSGIVSKQKGLGGALLLAAMSGERPILAVCRDELIPFYQKYGFSQLYKAGCWRK